LIAHLLPSSFAIYTISSIPYIYIFYWFFAISPLL
jgi:hypothetical protein